MDELIDFDADVKEIEDMIEKTSEETQKKIDWTKVWSKKYPVLGTYQEVVNIDDYVHELRRLLKKLRIDYGYNDVDALLVLKDILSKVWKDK